MSILLRVPERVEKDMLLDLCAGNRSCELVYRIAPHRKVKSKVRLLAVSDEELITERPVYHGQQVELPCEKDVRFYFFWNDRRYTTVSSVRRSLLWPTGRAGKVPALAVARPCAIEKAWRRGSFRLSMVNLPSAPIALQRIESLDALGPQWAEGFCQAGRSDGDVADGCVVDPASMHARKLGLESSETAYHGELLNLSDTGCCAVFGRDPAHLLAQGDLFVASFVLGGDASIQVVAEIRWHGLHPDGERMMAGMAWQLDPDNETHRAIQSRIGRFIMQQQSGAGGRRGRS